MNWRTSPRGIAGIAQPGTLLRGCSSALCRLRQEDRDCRPATTQHKTKTKQKEEQKKLRSAYVANVRANLRGQLDNISIVEKDGSITDLGKKHGDKGNGTH